MLSGDGKFIGLSLLNQVLVVGSWLDLIIAVGLSSPEMLATEATCHLRLFQNCAFNKLEIIQLILLVHTFSGPVCVAHLSCLVGQEYQSQRRKGQSYCPLTQERQETTPRTWLVCLWSAGFQQL